MQKTYVLDTNVLMQAPYALESFEDNHIVLPLAVLEELDGLKRAEGEPGSNARQVIRFLEQLRRQGNLLEGVPLPGGGTLRLEVNHIAVPLPDGMDPSSRDGRVLKVCRGLLEEGTPATLVTRDIVSRIKAQMMGVPAEDFTTDQVPSSAAPYTGRADVYVPNELLASFRKKGLPAGDLYTVDQDGARQPVRLTENQFLLLRSDVSEKKTMLGRFHGGRAVPLVHGGARPFGVKPRSVGQQFLQEALLLSADEAPLVIVKGPAGTAKTFYTLAAGLEQVLEAEERPYRKILVCRPNAQFDADIGFLPGSEQEKISPSCGPLWTIWKFCWIWRGRKRSGAARRSCGGALTTSLTPASSLPRP